MIVNARRVRAGDDVLDLHGWRRVSENVRCTGGGRSIQYVGGGLRYAHAEAPMRVRRLPRPLLWWAVARGVVRAARR